MLKKWAVLKEMKHVLGIPYRATIELQNRELTLSDLYGIWITMELHLNECCAQRSKFKTTLPKKLLNALNARKSKLLDNEFMPCALYLDPRYHREVEKTPGLYEKTKQTLQNLWNRIHSNEPSVEQISINRSLESNSSVDFSFDASTALDKYLSGVEQEPTPNIENDTTDISDLIDMFQPDPIPSKESVLIYWETVREQHPQLHKLATIIFAIPPTEVQIERDFSKLDYVFTDRRCSLTQERLEDIMLLNLNPTLFFEIKIEELIELENQLMTS